MKEKQAQMIAPLTVFYSYAHEDEALRDALEKHLSLLRRQGLIAAWHDRQIVPGTDWAQALDDHLQSASIILLLVSPDFLASDYCYGVEMQQALARHQVGDACVIPIILRPVDWENAPFAHLACLPRDGKPVTTWTDRDEAFVEITKGIRRVIEGLSPVSGMPQRPSQSVIPSASASSRQPVPSSSAPLDLNRQRMLKRVRSIWITGVLEQSLHGAVLIELGLQGKPDALANPWRLLMQELDQSAQALPTGTRITQVYDQADGELLILGEPGSGKTTLLLELARDLLDRAHANAGEPIPVVFNLSSWAKKRPPLANWLVEELSIRYDVPRRLGQSWINDDRLLLLLDGLDEVASDARKECIQAINRYRQEHSLVPVVVCSRSTDYLDQDVQLHLDTAVVVQPLTQEQINAYLMSAGEQAEALHEALRCDPDLQELAMTPLMLTILLFAYQGTPPDEITALDTLEAKREQVFASYVQHMLKRRGTSTRYTQEQTTHWLMWLARQMKQQSQTVFYIEHMQPDWLSGVRRLRAYGRWAVRFPGILIGMLVSGILFSLTFTNSPASSGYQILVLFFFAPYITLGGLIGWLLSAGSTPLTPQESRGFWPRLLGRLGVSLFIGLLYGPLYGLAFGPSYGPLYGLAFGLIYGLSYGLCSIPLQILLEKSSTAVSGFQASRLLQRTMWQSFKKSVSFRNGMAVGLLLGLASGLTSGLTSGLLYGLLYGPSYELAFGLIAGLTSGLTSGLFFGLSTGLLSVLLIRKPVGISLTDKLVWSWRGLGRSLLSKRHVITSLRIMVLVGLIAGLNTALSYGPSYVSSYGLLSTLIIGLTYGLIVGLTYGLVIGLSIWLLLGLFQGVSSQSLEGQHRIVPNQGIHRSARNGLVAGLIGTGIAGLAIVLSNWLITGLIFRLSTGLGDTLNVWLIAGPWIGLLVGLLVGFLNGGLSCLRHSVLRLLLWRAGSIPWNYRRFLDYAAERILLRKVGGGYIFIHRLLLDYFASLTFTTPTNVAKDRH